MFTKYIIWYSNFRIFVWLWSENARTKQKQQTSENRAIWFVCRTDTNARGFGWLSKRLAEKTSCPKNFLEINRYFALTSYRNTIGQSDNAFFILRFSLAGKRGVYVWSFIHWVIKQITNSYRNHFSRSYENRSIPPRGVVLPALREFENFYGKVFRSYGTTLTARKFERLTVQKFER